MAKKRRQARIPTPAWERPRGTIGSRVLGRGFQFYGAVAVALLVVAALGIIGYGVINDELEKRARPGSTAIQVEDTRYRVDYFASRLKMFVDQSGGPGAFQESNVTTAFSTVSDLLIEEEIVRRFAGEFDISATDEEIREEMASRLGIAADDESFDVVFEQELARSELSEADYRDMIAAAVLIAKLTEKFSEEVPESAESVHYRQILVGEKDAADEIVGDIEGGGDFAALAAEDFNVDVANKENGGDVGWISRGVLDASLEELLFALDIGEITTIPVPQGVFVVEMLEKAEDRAIEETQIAPLAGRAFTSWIQEKEESLDIVTSIVPGADGYDEKKAEWAVDRAFQS